MLADLSSVHDRTSPRWLVRSKTIGLHPALCCGCRWSISMDPQEVDMQSMSVAWTTQRCGCAKRNRDIAVLCLRAAE